jgi:hypothetical protein
LPLVIDKHLLEMAFLLGAVSELANFFCDDEQKIFVNYAL